MCKIQINKLLPTILIGVLVAVASAGLSGAQPAEAASGQAIKVISEVHGRVRGGEKGSYTIESDWNGNADTADSQAKAENLINQMCAGDAAVGYAWYVSRAELKDNGTIDYDVKLLYRRCSDSKSTRMYAITGYNQIIAGSQSQSAYACPVAGWYHNGTEPTHDCVKYQSAWDLAGVNICGRRDGYPINSCGYGGRSGENVWQQVYKGGNNDQPKLWTESTEFHMSTERHQLIDEGNGRYKFVDSALGTYYLSDSNNGDGSKMCTNPDTSRPPRNRVCNNREDEGIKAWFIIKNRWTQTARSRVTKISQDGQRGETRENNLNNPLLLYPGENALWEQAVWNIDDGSDNVGRNDETKIHLDTEVLKDNNGVRAQRDWYKYGDRPEDSFLARDGVRIVNPGRKADFEDGGGSNQVFGNAVTRARDFRTNGWYDGSPITQDDVGTTTCRRIAYYRLWTDTTMSHGNFACIRAPYHYPPCYGNSCSNNPGGGDDTDCVMNGTCPDGQEHNGSGVIPRTTSSVDGAGTSVITYDQTVEFNYSFTNEKGPTKSKSTEYRRYVFGVKSGVDTTKYKTQLYTSWPVPGSRINDKIYDLDNLSADWTGSINPGDSRSGEKATYTYNGNMIGDWGDVGDQICSYVALGKSWSVQDDRESNTYIASNVVCVRIAKQPQIQLNGSDSYAGQGFDATSYKSGGRGSYEQFGELTNTGAVSNFGSAGYTMSSAISNSQKIIFKNANRSSDGSPENNIFSGLGSGGILSNSALETLRNLFNNARTDLTSDRIALDNLSGTHKRSGDLTINASTVSARRSVQLFVNGNITITGNIINNCYGGSGCRVDEIPSVLIYATGNVTINNGVTRIDAVIVAGGDKSYVSTCDASFGPSGGKSSVSLGYRDKYCNNKLTINGAIISKNSPRWLRTFGSGSRTNINNQYQDVWSLATSEWVNYTPNLWLSSNLGFVNDYPRAYDTIDVRALPVRY